ncbi:GntR family transcriptional regulator [Actinomadura nitritigenes]|uniref:GntR family transcriptional regulator n=1 Tax=Actinomadura nitritigenes TaxID=134602 RepID=A0ABS3QWU1_9ACTN|nr:GntR family transcriptional regulator [Actinomadura nitritigenes]MBO2438453.1 GntR family transcriptional regulator [Actinomadura nitritigenes]
MQQTDVVYRRLRDLIVAGRYMPGERLTELSVSAALEVSRTPVREALRRLEGDGLVEGTGRGVVVNALTPERLGHAYEVRAALEALTAELAADRQRAGRVPPADLDDLERHAVLLEEVTAAGDLDRAIGLNRGFHRGIAEMAGNPIALETLDRLWDQIIVSTRDSLAAPDRPDTVADEHRRLLRAIAQGDRELAGRIAGDHARATRATLT